ncbi:hypothetical protein [Empedobacter falsenii]|uniref:Uncharacterized protein n=1 Tax=Empedobacter falsenii TaxID=343874 RepID=A0AAW7DGC6_9FLAO|nr:hypothetical protein [Empedobacter falsenii]MDM1551059.1 hypothetical protein [Empedobacter falsenii]HCC95086.1 hypothetical protein [Flavobacteriaceae bacterium]
MEQNKITFAHLFLGIFVIGLVLMAISFTDIVVKNNVTIFSFSIFILELVICLFAMSFYLKIDKISELFLGKVFSNSGQIFVWTNITWLCISVAFVLDETMIRGFHDLSFYLPFLGYLLFLLIIVNFFAAIFYTNFDDEETIGFSYLNYFSIFLAVVLILFFSLIIILFAVFEYPSISICFMMFNIYLINIIAKILKLKA